MHRSKYFNLYFNEEGEEMQQDPNAMQDPNAQMQDPNAMQDPSMMQQQTPAMMLDKEKTDSKTDEKFPTELDGTTPEQDLLNFTNYQKLQYFKKFERLFILVEKTKNSFNSSKCYINFDDVDNEKQHKIINMLIASIEEISAQTNFFLQKGIASVNIDKTRAIFNALIKKLNIVIDSYEEVLKYVKQKEDEKNNERR